MDRLSLQVEPGQPVAEEPAQGAFQASSRGMGVMTPMKAQGRPYKPSSRVRPAPPAQVSATRPESGIHLSANERISPAMHKTEHIHRIKLRGTPKEALGEAKSLKIKQLY